MCHDVVWCGVAGYNTALRALVVQCGAACSSAVQCGAVRCNVVQCSVLWCGVGWAGCCCSNTVCPSYSPFSNLEDRAVGVMDTLLMHLVWHPAHYCHGCVCVVVVGGWCCFVGSSL